MALKDVDASSLPRRTILLVCCLGMSTLGFPMAAPAVCLTAISEDMGLSATQMGLLGSATMVGLMVAILATGFLADRWGFRLFLCAGAVCNLLGFVAMARAEYFSVLLFGAGIAGVSIGMSDALLTPVVCAAYPGHRTRVANLIHAFYPIGLIFTILLTMALRQFEWDWRAIFMLLGLGTAPYGVAILIIRLPRQSHEGPDRQRTGNILSHAAFWVFAAALFLAAVTEMGPAVWLPAFLEMAVGTNRNSAALGLLLFAIAMAVARLCALSIVQRTGARRLFIVACLLSAVCVLMAALPASAGMTAFWLTLLGFTVAGLWPTLLGCAGDRFPRAGASLYSLLGVMGASGAAVAPLTVGVVADTYNLRVGLGVLTAAPILAAVVAIFFPTSSARRSE